MANHEQKNQIPKWLLILVLFSVSVAIILIGLYFWKFSGFRLYFWEYLSEKKDEWGQFGDYVGGILNPLFSLIALCALLYTIQLQSKEMHDSTLQLQKSAKALELQNNVLVRQQFETTFFQMLTLFNEIIDSIETTAPVYEDKYEMDGYGQGHLIHQEEVDNKVIKGRKCFNEFYERLKNEYHHNHNYGNGVKDERMRINELYKSFYREHQYDLGHYFRTLYNIIKFVKNSNVHDKHFYTNLVRAQLSSQELLLLFYNALSDLGNEKFKPLIEEFALLKTVPHNLLIDDTHHKFYANSAYYKTNPPVNSVPENAPHF